MDAMGIQHNNRAAPHLTPASVDDVLTEPRGSAAPDRSGPPRKRRRLVVSCTECHRRKQKCDRDLPCANCRSRNKESACTYESEPKTHKGPAAQPPAPRAHDGASASPPRHAQTDTDSSSGKGKDEAPLSNFAASLGYSSNTASTMSFLKRLESPAPASLEQATAHGTGSEHYQHITKEKFRSLIKQLPAKSYMDKLIPVYFEKFNYQYYALDPSVFDEQLREWHSIPFRTLSTQGPSALSRDMKVFPAVLFQVIATALLVLPQGDADFEGLKYASTMTFEDLALDYSESGQQLVQIFDKKELSLTAIQAEFLRAAFLKYTAHVTESWHAVSVAIKDAQELGMHSDALDPKPEGPSAEAALENQWLVQRRRKMYLILWMWDISMTIFLGRPGTINKHHSFPTLPVDTVMPEDRSREPVVLRNEWRDPPTPLAGLLWLRQVAEPLFDIQELEREGPHPKDPSKIEEIHKKIDALEERKPAIFRVDGTDLVWDDRPDMQWLKFQRWYYTGLQAFNKMALHRPYVFHRKQSRDEALKASLETLETGRQMFLGLPPDHWRNYHLFFGSFDAIVLLSSIYTIFPFEYPEHKQRALQQFHWTIERFSAMQERNPLARSAQGVLKAIFAKFTKAISVIPEVPLSGLGPTPPSTHVTTPASSSSNNKSAATSNAPFDSGLIMNDAEATAFPSGWSMPSTDVLSSLQPMYPTYDLLFNDLNVIDNMTGTSTVPLGPDPSLSTAGPPADATAILTDADSMPWHFGGGFGEDTVWTFLNQFQPGTSGTPG